MFKVISLQTGEMKEVELIDLSRNLMLNSIVSSADGALGLITHQDLVFFAYTWGTWALEASKTKKPEAVEALRLVGLWLEDSESVSDEELKAAARATTGVACWAAWTSAAGPRVAADDAARAARAAAEAAGDGAARAAWAAGDTAEAAAGAASRAARAATYQKQGEFILDRLQKTSQTSFPFRRT
jgi:hypothetical protein